MRNLDGAAYVEPTLFARERQNIFAATWQLLGPASPVAEPQNYVAAEIAGLKVFVLRGRDGVLRGFRNVCRHRGARLLEEGNGKCSIIRCPYHNWAFDDRGNLITAPWFGEDPDFKTGDWPLTPIEVREWRGLLFAAISPRQGLEEQLGDLVAELADEPLERYTAIRCERMEFQANWKIYTDNFVEGYHIPGIHPQFFAAIQFEQFSTTAHDGLVRMTAPPREGLF
ncbi:MAG: aromatic ring-hydroxylating dioxygenase subunit alpha, partial [Pseudomonadota bacterium]|nr:aromatic ring-hydroxylating dioxygenase subunit alpha [Pseudomonadota bacterium]